MRRLASFLIALLLAASAVILGYAGWLALRRVVLPGAVAVADTPLRAGPPAPQRLFPAEAAAAAANGAGMVAAADLRIGIAIALANLPSGLDRNRAGVAIFGSQDGSDFQFHALAALGDDLILRTQTQATDALRITLAEDAGHARHSYLCRVDHEFARQPTGAVPLRLDASAQRVRFLPGEGLAPGPLHLRRLQDPDWHAPQLAAAGVRSHPEAPCELWLGAGQYELRDPLRPERSQLFAVPGTGTVVLSPVFASARNDRP